MELRNSGTKVALLWVCVCLWATAEAQQAESRFKFGAEVSSTWDYNIGISPDDNDKFDVFTTTFSADLGYTLVQRQGFEVDATVTPFYSYVSDLGDLSHYGATVGFDVRGEFGPGFTQPWYSFSFDYTVAQWDDSDPRDGDWIEFEAAIGKRFSPKFGLSGGYRYLKRWQDDDNPECISGGCADRFGWKIDEVFDHSKNGLFAHADWFAGDKTSFFLEYSFWDGDVASTGLAARPNTAVTDDLAFGRRNTNPTIYRVWRAEAELHIVELGADRRLTDRLSAGLSGRYLWTTDVSSPVSEEDYETAQIEFFIRFDR